ncbi:unnamed protein product [Schistosoma bovis]|nr:unnamed protein product [Schistosoma bovis]
MMDQCFRRLRSLSTPKLKDDRLYNNDDDDDIQYSMPPSKNRSELALMDLHQSSDLIVVSKPNVHSLIKLGRNHDYKENYEKYLNLTIIQKPILDYRFTPPLNRSLIS